MTNVVITHHGPSTLSLPEGEEGNVLSAAFVSNLESVITNYKPKIWIHGHLHNSSNYRIGNFQVICNPRGYPGERNPNFKSDLIIEI